MIITYVYDDGLKDYPWQQMQCGCGKLLAEPYYEVDTFGDDERGEIPSVVEVKCVPCFWKWRNERQVE